MLVLKLYRRVTAGLHPEVEVGNFLTDVAKYANTPPLLGSIEMIDEKGKPTALAAAHGFVRNQGDGWSYTLNYLERALDDRMLMPVDSQTGADTCDLSGASASTWRSARRNCIGPYARTVPIKPSGPNRSRRRICRGYVRKVQADARTTLATLAAGRKSLTAEQMQRGAPLLDKRSDLLRRIGGRLPAAIDAVKTRIHGDYHLGQVVVAQNDFYILDFEGEPKRPIADGAKSIRRSKMSRECCARSTMRHGRRSSA